MTFNEAKKLLKSKNMYFIKENAAFGSLEEYKAKLSDLWADNYTTDNPDEASFDEILAIDSLRTKYPWVPTTESMKIEKARLDAIGY